MSKAVLDMNDRRPAWAMPPWVPERIREALPPGWTLEVMSTEADGSGDGVARVGPRLLEAIRDAEIYFGYGVPAELLRAGSHLRWVHSGAAGVKASLTPEMLASPVLFTNSRGIHGPPMGETVLGMILYFSRGLNHAVAAQARERWEPGPFLAAENGMAEFPELTVGIVGYGGVGREVARRVRALGGRVIAYDRAGGGEGEDAVLHGPEGLARLLRESDYLVLTAPDTPLTRGLLSAESLALMKPSAVVINVSRGSLVDEEALVAALREGRIRGAALDVFGQEPLPEGHPLWSLPNVLLTPHVSAVSRLYWPRQTELIVENLRRFFAGEPLLNLVDKAAGF